MPEPLTLPYNDKELRIDYDGRTDGQGVYIGFAAPETPTSEARWTIQKFTFDGSNNVTRRQLRYKIAWDSRTSSF